MEAVGFVDRAFAILYDHDLERQWTLTDVEGNKHVDTYNKNLQKPMLIGRWTDLRNLYQLHDNHTIYFGYVGHSCFQITVFPSKCKPLSIGRFLKRLEVDEPLFNGPKLHFFIFLNPNQCHASHLVRFISFNRWMFIWYLYLCLQNFLKHLIHILNWLLVYIYFFNFIKCVRICQLILAIIFVKEDLKTFFFMDRAK